MSTSPPARVFRNPHAVRRPYGATERTIISHAAFREAYEAISKWPEYHPTPLLDLQGAAHRANVGRLWYKDEASRFGLRSFKALGGAYGVQRALAAAVSAQLGGKPVSLDDIASHTYADIVAGITVTTATDGNHGRSVAWGAQRFGCKCVIYLPAAVSAAREQAIAAYGADIVRTTMNYDDTVRLAEEDAKRFGRLVISDTSYKGYEDIPRDVMQGYTVMVEEVLTQLEAGATPTHVFVQAGVGGLAAAVFGHLWEHWGAKRPTFVVVEPHQAACLYRSAQAGQLTRIEDGIESVMAGLSCGEVSPLAWRIVAPSTDAFVSIPDSSAAETVQMLANSIDEDPPIVAGESGVAGVAALFAIADDAEARELLGLTEQSRVLTFGTEGATNVVG